MVCFEDKYRGRRVLITGHTGFKGSWLALWLNNLGADVAGFSLDVPTEPSNFTLLGLKGCIKHLTGDIRDRVSLEQVFDEFRPEVVFHLAAQSLVGKSYLDPLKTFETNTLGMVNLLECIRTRGSVEVAVLITSDKAYRNDEWCWGYREIDPLGGCDPYSGSKSCADLVAQSYCHSFFRGGSTRIGIARAGNVIGGGDWASDRIVPDSIRAWSKETPVSVRNPLATRPWQHVLEPLSGYLALGADLLQNEELNGEAFNFGPDGSVNQTVGQLLDAMSNYWHEAHWTVPLGYETNGQEALLLKLSSDKAQNHLNWSAVLKFEETVSFTMKWYLSWFKDSGNLYDFSLEQLDEYCRLAEKRELSWITL